MVSSSQEDVAGIRERIDTPVTYIRPILEWIFWVGFAALVYAQTGYFDKKIPEYAFGATGWPRALTIAMIIGATGQFVYQMASIWRGKDLAAIDGDDSEPQANGKTATLGSKLQRLGIFVVPLIYLYLMPRIGFYVATPIFVVVLLLLFEVRSVITIATVTAIVYGLALLVFTRFFYVALPTGRIEAFYDINNAIISIVRAGM
ncbi:hypothetical protein GGD81_001784 [Rhodobium orientis]|uniref:DUF1468 domain-containing protein n=1 Tax=Rhodobium orientis TaxID=34017 RepID=A0A327K334_9HYPH|nr:tripartite tricarboxylate transporter TctB family protein [Rhodobium orientis]MBB4302748.1 hypothetical protein [Rhodobium orientis]MBK5948529.1 hypothetical protein [Rhodobium orientis]RAI29798.1 hypothetical protein CH339_01915 [Rhodobium orientis]